MATTVVEEPDSIKFRMEGLYAVDAIFELQGHVVVCSVFLLPDSCSILKQIRKGELSNGFFTSLPLSLIADSTSV